MKIEKQTIVWMFILVIVAFGACVLLRNIDCKNSTLLYDLSLGVFGSAFVSLLVSFAILRSKFSATIEQIFFICKKIKNAFDKTYFTDEAKFELIVREIAKLHKEFYYHYQEIEYIFLVNCKYKKPIIALFEKYSTFIVVFLTLEEQYDYSPNLTEEINHKILEIKTMGKINFAEFIACYVDLYKLIDERLCNERIKWDEEFINCLYSKNEPRTPLTIREIIDGLNNKNNTKISK